MIKRVLCFGDSNTYGHSVEPGARRYDEHTRWPMQLQTLLGDAYAVIEEGLSGRTTVHDDPTEGGYRSALTYLPPCLMSHAPLDVVALMLGTNDAKERFSMNPHTISHGIRELIFLIRRYAYDADGNPSKILLIAPIEIGDWLMDTDMAPIFGLSSIEVSRGFAAQYARVAEETGCAFLDAARVAKPSREDAIHLGREGHAQLARAVYEKIIKL